MRPLSKLKPSLAKSLLLTSALSLMAMGPSLRAQMTTTAVETPTNPHNAANEAVADPRQYLEEVLGDKALAFAKTHTEASLKRLEADPRFDANRAEALKILSAKDRIAMPAYTRDGQIDNFWQDSDHVRGLWRRTDWASYAAGEPKWDILLDVDALAKAEGKNWVYRGANCLPHAQNLCLIHLSDGGKDAVTIREYDLNTKSFVKGGFELPEGKQSVEWINKDTIYVSREWKKGEVTPSGYAYITKRLKRGQALSEAVEIFAGDPKDVSAGRNALRDNDDNYVMDTYRRGVSFFETEMGFYTDKGVVHLPLPLSANFSEYFKGQAIYDLKSEWTSAKGTHFASGSIISFDLKAALKDPKALEPTLIFAPDASQSVAGLHTTKDHLIIALTHNVTGEVRSYGLKDGVWTFQKLNLPENSTLSLGSADPKSDHIFVTATNFLLPATLYRLDAGTGAVELIKSSPTRFNAEGLDVTQHWATSKDGTKIPYFLVAKKGVVRDGTTPTLLYAYGGFELSSLPNYNGTLGKLWLEKGGAYVMANIRGGGEFGPKWHEAGLKTKRQVIYDDFQAVAQDLIDTKLTSQKHLGIMGRSNGGLLMGVQFTQRPDLWNAVIIESPLLDMLRFNKLLSGASWMGEYGNPSDAKEGAFLRSISPYHNVKAGVAYPEPLIITSTKDDRVHPGHARKLAALLEDMGLPFYYYENIDGGHAASANLNEIARHDAIEYTYLARKLVD